MENDNRNKISDSLRSLMCTRARVCEEVRVSQSSLSHWLAGSRTPGIANRMRIIKLMRTQANELKLLAGEMEAEMNDAIR